MVGHEQSGGGAGAAVRDARHNSIPSETTVVSLEGIGKSYQGVRALSDINLDLRSGEVHAVVGENGAGKSTLLKIVAGMITPDEGRIRVDGREVGIDSTRAARAMGISAVPQELSLVSHLSVAENICVAALPAYRGVVSRRRLRQRSIEVLEQLGLDIDPLSPLENHGPGIQSLVMIGRGLVQDARVLVLDEPTASLTAPEIDHLFDVIGDMRRRGVAFLYVSHRLQELGRIAQTITVLRDGQCVTSVPVGTLDHDQLVRAMVGRPVEALAPRGRRNRPAEQDPPRLKVTNLSRRGAFEDVSFSIHAGEIVGLAGLIGAGRTEVARAVFGIDRLDGGDIEVDGQRVKVRTPRDAIRHGIVMVPEERKSQALVLGMSVEANMTVAELGSLARRGWIRRRPIREVTRQQVRSLDVRTPGTHAPVGSLSGGNQQKVVIGRWLIGSHRVYLFDEPTRGVDVGAKFAIHEILRGIKDKGAGLLVISSELLELMTVCDRILVMREGRLVNEIEMDSSVTEEQILRSAIRPRAAA